MARGPLVLFQCFIEVPVFYANIVNPDQMLQNVAPGLGLKSLRINLSMGFRTKMWRQVWV